MMVNQIAILKWPVMLCALMIWGNLTAQEENVNEQIPVGFYDGLHPEEYEEDGEGCDDLLRVEELSILRFSREAQVIIRTSKQIDLNQEIILQSGTGATIRPEWKNNVIFSEVQLNEDYTVEYETCGEVQVLGKFNTHPHDRDIPLEVSSELFAALERQNEEKGLMYLMKNESSASMTEKMSFLQKHIAPKLPIKEAYKIHSVSDLVGSNTLSKNGDDYSWMSEMPTAAGSPEDFFEIEWPGEDAQTPGLIIEDDPNACNCNMVILSSNLFVLKRNDTNFPKFTDDDNNSVLHAALTTLSDHKTTRKAGRYESSFERWEAKLGAGVITKLTNEGSSFLGALSGEPKETITVSNMDHIPYPVNDGEELGNIPVSDYQAVSYRIHCSLNQFPAACGCEKDLKAKFVFGHDITVESASGFLGESKAGGSLMGIAYSYEEGNNKLDLVGAKAFAAQMGCNASWNKDWGKKYGKMATAATTIALDVVQNDIQDLDEESVQDFFTNLVDFATTQLVNRNCSYASYNSGGNLVMEEKSFVLRPNKSLHLIISAFYEMEVYGKLNYENSVLMRSHAGIATLLKGNSRGVPYQSGNNLHYSSPYTCCSKLYGNYLLSSPGKSYWSLSQLQSWASGLYGLQVWDPHYQTYPGTMAPLITGNYGRLEGPQPADCIDPIPIPKNKVNWEVKNLDKDIVINSKDGTIGINYILYSLDGKELKRGTTNENNQVIYSKNSGNGSAMYMVRTYRGSINDAKKIVLP